MVDYPPFRATLKKKEISTYCLIKCKEFLLAILPSSESGAIGALILEL